MLHFPFLTPSTHCSVHWVGPDRTKYDIGLDQILTFDIALDQILTFDITL